MRIAMIQMAPRFGELQRNREHALQMAAGCAADLVVLPELFTSGYLFQDRAELEALAEPATGPTVGAFADLCRSRGCWAVGGFPERTAGGIYNSAFVVGPAGLVGVYRKVHLFWDEKDLFTPGDLGFPVWDTGGCRIGVLICFDWAFPEAARSLALGGAQVLVHPSNLVLPHAQTAMVTRSLENRVFVATANRVGSDERGGKSLTFTGCSQVLAPDGLHVGSLGPEEEGCLVVDVDPARADEKLLTPRNHVLLDRRPEMYRS